MSASANQRSQLSDRRAVQQKRMPVSILVFATALFVSCQRPASEDSQAQPSSDRAAEMSSAPPVAQPQGFGKVRLEIENRQPLKLSLFRILGNDLIPTGRQIESATQLEVDSGFYLLQSDDRSVQCPVPAIAPFVPDNTIRIQVAPVPQPEPGWCWIPSGPAIVGDTLGVGREDERPARMVDLPGFWMGETEVTNRQYAQFLSSQKTIDDTWIDIRSRKCLIQKDAEGKFVPNSTVADAAKMPVVMVSLKPITEEPENEKSHRPALCIFVRCIFVGRIFDSQCKWIAVESDGSADGDSAIRTVRQKSIREIKTCG